MSLAAGTRLGPYEIITLIGQGGMGEVYRAHDLRLNRTVAIKVLPTHVADDPDLKQRFEREAKALAALSHPHICSVFDVGREGSVGFLVMEYLDGETLAQRLDRGALPVDQALRCAIQIADALDRAHRTGIVHRDLKPGNIMLTRGGVKLLDFGLAKLKPASDGTVLSALTTGEASMTAQGTILGTRQYMAPEQLEGREADPRTDIFAFGAVVYEMVTGKKAFEGKSQASLVGAIMNVNPPPMAGMAPLVPAGLDRLVGACLAKSPEERWQSAGDLRRQLQWMADLQNQPEASARATRWPPARRLMLGPAAMLLAAAVWGLVVLGRPAESARPLPVTRTLVLLPLDQMIAPGGLPRGAGPTQAGLAVSPDGRQVAYGAARDGTSRLFIRSLGELESRALPGTEGANFPFFSPDGEWLGFFADDELQKVRLAGGAPIRIAAVPLVNRGASWGPGDVIVYSAGNPAGLWRVSAAGGTPEALTTPEAGAPTHTWPHVLPDGRSVIFSLGSDGSGGLGLLSFDSPEWNPLLDGPAKQARYVPTGHLVYANEGAVRAVAFDLRTLEPAGSPVPVFDPVFDASNSGGSYFAVSDTGTFVYVPGGVDFSLVWVDRAGTATALAQERKGYRFPMLSPDERQVAVTVDPADQGNSDIWIYDTSGGGGRRLTLDGHNIHPVWTPDGSRVAYSRNGVFWQLADGTGGETRRDIVVRSPSLVIPRAFSPNGKSLVFGLQDPETGWDLGVASVDGDETPELVASTPFREDGGEISPDGRWLAFTSDESGRSEVYVQAFSGTGGRILVSSAGGTQPVWSGSGAEIFYRNGAQMVAVPVGTGETFQVMAPIVLFENASLVGSGGEPRFDVTRDGHRFVMVRDNTRAQGGQIHVVQHWDQELKRLVPGD